MTVLSKVWMVQCVIQWSSQTNNTGRMQAVNRDEDGMPWIAKLYEWRGHHPVIQAAWCRRTALPAAVEEEGKGLFCSLAKAKAKCAEAHAPSCSQGPGQHSLHCVRGKPQPKGDQSHGRVQASPPLPSSWCSGAGQGLPLLQLHSRHNGSHKITHVPELLLHSKEEPCSLAASWLLASTTTYVWTQQQPERSLPLQSSITKHYSPRGLPLR